MKEEKKVISFDIDGVVATSSRILDFFVRKVQHYYFFSLFWSFLMETPIGDSIYKKRRVNKIIIEEIKNLQDQGFSVILISAIFQNHKQKVEEWLKKNQVPFDGLILQKKGESLVFFKTRALMEIDIDNLIVYLDDDIKLVMALNLAVPGKKAIHYKGQALSFLFVE